MSELIKVRAGGSLQSNFTDAAGLTPVSEWANEILGEAIISSPIASIVEKGGNLRRANKKQLYFKSKVTNGAQYKWATGTSEVRDSSYETALDLDTMFIDPFEYRTMTPVAWETLDEIDMFPIEAYVRYNLTQASKLKITQICYEAVDTVDKVRNDAIIDEAYDWYSAGNALTMCDGNTAVDYGDGLSADNFKSGVETLIAVGYIPDSLVVPPALYMDLFNESQFMNAAQYGAQNSAILEGKIPNFLGVDTYLDLFMPDDSSDKDVGIMIDSTKYMGLVVSNDPRIDVDTNYNTGEVEFFMTLKSSSSVIQETAGVAFYS